MSATSEKSALADDASPSLVDILLGLGLACLVLGLIIYGLYLLVKRQNRNSHPNPDADDETDATGSYSDSSSLGYAKPYENSDDAAETTDPCAGVCVNANGYYLRATPDMSQPDLRGGCCEQKTCKGASVVCPTGTKQREDFDTLPIQTYTENAEKVCCVMDLGQGSCGGREPAKQTGGSREGKLGSCEQAGKCHYGRNGGYAKCCGGLYNAVNGKMCVADEDEEQCKDGPTMCSSGVS